MPLAVSSSSSGSRDSPVCMGSPEGDLYGLSQVSSALRHSKSRIKSHGHRCNNIIRSIGRAGRRIILRRDYECQTDTEAGDASSSCSPPCRKKKISGMGKPSTCNPQDSSARGSMEPDSSHNFLADTSHKCRPGWTEESGRWIFGQVIDPRTRQVQRWNRVFLITCLLAASVDPLFLYVLSVNTKLACVYANQKFAVTVTIIRAFVDAMYLFHMYLQMRLAYVSKKSLVLGRGILVWDARQIAKNYVCDTWAFTFDVFVILPIPQFLFWLVVPAMIGRGMKVSAVLGVVLAVFLFQYIPRVLHMVSLIRRMQQVTGYIFGTAIWGFALNLIAYIVAAHVAGAVWYLLTLNEMERCAMARCWSMGSCQRRLFSCPRPLSGEEQPPFEDPARTSFAKDDYLQRHCFRNGGRYNFGIYHHAVPLPGQARWLNRILYPLFWGLMTLSSFGNALVPGNEPLELIFSIFVITCGLLLFMLLIGNIQVFLHSMTASKEMMQLRIRDVEWWMRRRQLPSRLRQRVRQYERQRWAATRGVDESSMVADLPEGLRRDIKRHLCLDLVRQVPLFEHMDDLVLDNVCERLTAYIFIKGEVVLREGDPVMRMLFLIRGHFQSSYQLKNDQSSYTLLGPGNFCGDELLSWCLRRTPVDRYPPSATTLVALDSAEVFALEARDLKFVVQHFRYKFEDEKMERTLRFYSSGWRMWAAVTIQLAWRRCKARRNAKEGDTLPPASLFSVPSAYMNMADSEAAMRNNRLRFFTAMITSPKPSTHLE